MFWTVCALVSWDGCILADKTLKADDVGLDESDLPAGFHEEFPRHSPGTNTGRYAADNLDLCRALAQSSRYEEALGNADSLASFAVICWFLVHCPQWDLTGPTVKKRDFIPSWVERYWNQHCQDERSPFTENQELQDLLDAGTDDDSESHASEILSLDSEDGDGDQDHAAEMARKDKMQKERFELLVSKHRSQDECPR